MIRLGIIGTGSMAANHAESFSRMRGVKLAACCDLDPARAKQFASQWKIPHWYADPRQLLAAETLDGVSVVTPDAAHASVCLAAIERGLAVLCEKPMATTLADARRMRDAARTRGVVTQVNFSYRNAPCVQEAAAFIRGGGIGRVLHAEASYLQSWLVQDTWGDWRTSDTFTWRLSRRHGSGGTLGDVGCHIYDMAALLAGDIRSIYCVLRTFDKGIPGNRVGEYVFDANDSFCSSVEFASGAIGTVQATRWATGHPNREYIGVYGDEGSVEIDYERGNQRLRFCDNARNEWDDVAAPPVPNLWERFVKAIRSGTPDECDFGNGLRIQRCLEASFRSARLGKAVSPEH